MVARFFVAINLRKERRNQRGFTLIELLVVIAIIAILVGVVVVAINPVEHLNQTRDTTADSNVRSFASSVGVCITKELSKQPPGNPFDAATCGDNNSSGNYLVASGYANSKPAILTVLVGDSDGDTVDDQICLYEEGRSGFYASWNSTTGALITSPFGVISCS